MTARRTVDLLIHARWVAPIAPVGVLDLHAVAVDDGAIVALLPSAAAREQFDARETVHLPEHLLMPGLINTHTHAPMTLMRGLADDLPLMRWLSEHIWPAEAKHMGPQFVADGTDIAIAESIRGGVTCFQDNYFFSEDIAARCRAAGFRATVGAAVIDFPSSYAKTADEYFARAQALIEREHGIGLNRVSIAPHAPYTVSDSNFRRAAELATQHQLHIHLHLHETAQEVDDAVAATGQRPLARLHALGLVGPQLNAVHMTQLQPAEIEQLASAGAHVLHCPESNLKLASGFCPAAALLAAGVNVAIGTDGTASNNDMDMIGEMRTAALLAKAVAGDAAAMGAEQTLYAATLGAARAIHRESEIGSIEPGKRADLAAVRFDALETQPNYEPISQLIYAAPRNQVAEVWIDGVRKLRDGQLVNMDARRLMAVAREWRGKIAG